MSIEYRPKGKEITKPWIYIENRFKKFTTTLNLTKVQHYAQLNRPSYRAFSK
jgi:hypothetical protein